MAKKKRLKNNVHRGMERRRRGSKQPRAKIVKTPKAYPDKSFTKISTEGKEVVAEKEE